MAAVTWAGAYPELALLQPVSALTFGLFFSQARGFVEHVVADGAQERGFVRSHRASLWDRLLLYDLNFHRHAEHHRFPQVPSVHLPQLSRRLTADGGAGPTMLGTIVRRIGQAPCPILSRLRAAHAVPR
jgi:fatty acid desaturase